MRSPSSAYITPLTELVGSDYPLVQMAMGWVSDHRLVAAVGEAGALGFLASATMSLSELDAQIIRVKERTDRPFGVNLRADAGDVDERINLLIRRGVKVAGFALAPRPDLISKLKDNGILVIPSVGAPRHAEKVAAWGADAVIVVGSEGGGHIGRIPSSLLVPAVVDAVDIPVIAAGGFYDGRGLLSALAYGAAGVGMGTRFLLTRECSVPDRVKRLYLDADLNGTAVSHRFDGQPLRVLLVGLAAQLESGAVGRGDVGFRLGNVLKLKRESGASWRRLMSDGMHMYRKGESSINQVLRAANTPSMMRDGLAGDIDNGVVSSGQVTGLIRDIPNVADLTKRIITEAEDRTNLLVTVAAERREEGGGARA